MNEAIKDLIGLTITRIVRDLDDSRLTIETKEKRTFAMYHMQDCCELVGIFSVDGNANICQDGPITKAEIVEHGGREVPADILATDFDRSAHESFRFTDLCLEAAAGSRVQPTLRVRWLGRSNGYYGETPYFSEVP